MQLGGPPLRFAGRESTWLPFLFLPCTSFTSTMQVLPPIPMRITLSSVAFQFTSRKLSGSQKSLTISRRRFRQQILARLNFTLPRSFPAERFPGGACHAMRLKVSSWLSWMSLVDLTIPQKPLHARFINLHSRDRTLTCPPKTNPL